MMVNCYYGPNHRNNAYQLEFTWITDSLAWLNTVPSRDMLGVKADYRGLVIDPCLPSE
jgi:cellobiose phosphorylase